MQISGGDLCACVDTDEKMILNSRLSYDSLICIIQKPTWEAVGSKGSLPFIINSYDVVRLSSFSIVTGREEETGTVQGRGSRHAAAAPGNGKIEASLVSTRHTAVADVDIGGWRTGCDGGSAGCSGAVFLADQPRTLRPRSGLLHQGVWPDSCTARPRRPDVMRVIAVTGAEGEGAGEGGWFDRRDGAASGARRFTTDGCPGEGRARLGGLGTRDGLRETRTRLKRA